MPQSRLEDRVLTVPNVLTLLRLLAVPVVILFLLAETDFTDLAAGVLFVLAALTDLLDGVIARRTTPTRLGALFDPVADRLMLSSVAIVLAARDLLPIWAVGILVGRDLLALIGGLVFGSSIRVSPLGKAATAVLMSAVAFVILGEGNLERTGEIMFYAGFALSLAAALGYADKVSRTLRHGGRR
ncbi:MAG: CDP-alcohol phosphatidyltransferase family protein [Actinomycetota bacterium]|jgi:CDP-diacylglycerol--glycerol-3-phosphate 3-phosphatidyltransferase|nr:CDP-alcohol phosphatidyltransferase family protein [Rubrobacter sp.]MDQ3566634.1 CDP-alcohol phosphatidyltransferase family protein [Actinomycetota bacterium]